MDEKCWITWKLLLNWITKKWPRRNLISFRIWNQGIKCIVILYLCTLFSNRFTMTILTILANMQEANMASQSYASQILINLGSYISPEQSLKKDSWNVSFDGCILPSYDGQDHFLGLPIDDYVANYYPGQLLYLDPQIPGKISRSISTLPEDQ